MKQSLVLAALFALLTCSPAMANTLPKFDCEATVWNANGGNMREYKLKLLPPGPYDHLAPKSDFYSYFTRDDSMEFGALVHYEGWIRLEFTYNKKGKSYQAETIVFLEAINPTWKNDVARLDITDKERDFDIMFSCSKK